MFLAQRLNMHGETPHTINESTARALISQKEERKFLVNGSRSVMHKRESSIARKALR